MHNKYLHHCILIGCIVVLTSTHPLEKGFRQDEDEDVEVTQLPSFGPQVAQIIAGALSGNLTSILQGSFNLVPNPEVQQSVHNTWGTIAGITSATTSTIATTSTSSTTTSTTAAAPTEVKTAADTDAPETPTESIDTEASTVKINNEDDDDEDGEEGAEFDEQTFPSRSKVLRVV